MPKVCIFDDGNRLVGYSNKSKPSKSDVVVPDNCDLPTDGSYHWKDGQFLPVGRGHGKPPRSQISQVEVLYHLCKKFEGDLPAEVQDWIKWYEVEIKKREGK